jgi:hypothetical protein
MREVLIGFPSIAFAFGIVASQFGAPKCPRAVSGDPSAIRALRYGGAGTVTMPASCAKQPYGGLCGERSSPTSGTVSPD